MSPILTKKNIEWLYALLRPKWHHRIAWSVVAAGIALTANPIWEPYLRSFAINLLNFPIDPPESDTLGVYLVAMGLIYHFLMSYMELRNVPAAEIQRLKEWNNWNDPLSLSPQQIQRLDDALPDGSKRVFTMVDNAASYTSKVAQQVSDLLRRKNWIGGSSRVSGAYMEPVEAGIELSVHGDATADDQILMDALEKAGVQFSRTDKPTNEFPAGGLTSDCLQLTFTNRRRPG